MHLMPLTWLAIAYFVLCFCYVPRIPEIPRAIDLSYGIYLWAFPVQQLLVTSGIDDPLVLFAITTPIVCVRAAFLLEKPARRLRMRVGCDCDRGQDLRSRGSRLRNTTNANAAYLKELLVPFSTSPMLHSEPISGI